MKLLTKATLYYLLHLVSKAVETKDDKPLSEKFGLTKDAASAIEAIRIEKDLGEATTATALGLESASDYKNYVTSGKGLSITAAGIKSLAKLFKMSVEDLAARMMSDDPNAEDATELPESDTTDTGAAGDLAKSKGKAKKKEEPIEKDDKTLQSAQIFHIKEEGSGGKVDLAKAENKEVAVQMLKCSLAGIRKNISIEKSELAPADLLQDATHIPEEAQGIIDLMISESDILNEISTYGLNSKKMQVQSADASNLRLVRDAKGWDVEGQKGTSEFLNFDLQEVRLRWEILDETVDLFKNNVAGLENFIFNQYRQAFLNRVAFLSFNGVQDTVGNTNTEINLSEGFFKLAEDQCDAAMILDSADSATQYDQWKALLNAQLGHDPNYNGNDQVILCSEIDFNEYLDELEERTDGAFFLTMSAEQLKNLTFRGKKFKTHKHIPSGKYLQTRMKNLAFAYLNGEAQGLQIKRYSQPGSTIYRASMWIDFGLSNPTREIAFARPE